MKALLNSAALSAVLALAACAQERTDGSNLVASAAPSSSAAGAQAPASSASLADASGAAAGQQGENEGTGAVDEAEPAAGMPRTDSGQGAGEMAADGAAPTISGGMNEESADAGGAQMASSDSGTAAPAGGQTQLAAMPPVSDEDFATFAARGDAAEIQMAQLAVTRASSPEVRAFAQHMIDDHTGSSVKLKSIAAAKGLSLPATPAGNGEALVQQLRDTSGEGFDEAYMQAQVRAHKQMLALMQSEAKGGEDPQLKAFASETAKAVQSHLQMAEQVVAKIGS